jgi:DNA-binding NarL/FixJ family response regulator
VASSASAVQVLRSIVVRPGAGTVASRRSRRNHAGMDRPTVLIVDDHAGFRAHARELLASGGFEIVAEAADGRTAIELTVRFDPTMVLLDVQLPDLDGFAVAREIVDGPSAAAVVLVSTRDAADYGRRPAGCGAVGFISKSRLSGDTLRAILRKSAKEGSR